MKTAILLRGHHYYTNPFWMKDENNSEIFDLTSRCNYAPKSFDYRLCFKNIEENLFNPIKKISELDIYISTQHSEIENSLYDIDGIKKVVYPEHPVSQNSTIIKGLESIEEDYDYFIMIRFDLVFKQPIINLWDYKRNETIFCLWRESVHTSMTWEPNLWEQHRRLPDTMHIVNGKQSFQGFKKSIEEFFPDNINKRILMPWGESIDTARGLHHLYPFLEKYCLNIDFLVNNGFYASNTSLPYLCSKNPIYVLYGRPYHFEDYPKI